MVEATPADPDVQLEELCRVLNHFGVRYVVFGSHVARLNGVDVETGRRRRGARTSAGDLERLADALNLVGPGGASRAGPRA